VHRNRLTSLPKELEELQQLTYLDVSHNCIRTYPGRVYKLSE
jgi:Leucine-rich repeat (LRR) protein